MDPSPPPPAPAAASVSWADRARAAQSAKPSNVPAAVVIAPVSATSQTSAADKLLDVQARADFTLPPAEKGTVILDANAFIKGFDNFLTTADVFVTTAAVIEECRDRKTRDFLDRIPVNIEVLEPSNDSIRKVVAMAEKTGDIGMLSKTDLRLCALALDCALQLKVAGPVVNPGAVKVNDSMVDVSSDEDEDSSSSDYDDDEDEGDENDDNWLDNTDSDSDGDEEKSQKKKDKKKKKDDEAADKKLPTKPKETLPGWGEFEDDWGAPTSGMSKNAMKRARKEEQKKAAAAAAATSPQQESSAIAQPTAENATTNAAASSSEQPASSSSSTAAAKLPVALDSQSYKGGFACVTSDFPMQNVLLHLGVPVTGTNGQCIHELRVWVLRCHACTCIVHDTSKQFCPDCGSGDTLKRVHYILDDKGEAHLFINFTKRISTRGTVFNLSKPRGGRKGTNKTLVLREDQLRNAGKGDSRKKANGDASNFDDEGLVGFGDRESQAGRRDGNFMMDHSSYVRKNVNEMRKLRASRKK